MSIQHELFSATSTSPLIGATLVLDRTMDRVNPCCSNTALVTAGSGAHVAGLVCADCGRHRAWLSRASVEKLHRVIELFGMPNTPFIIRDQSHYFADQQS
jgi:hypothetical protein